MGFKPRSDYGFGSRESAHILALVKASDYEAAEKGILFLDSDNLSHVVNHLSLSLPLEKIQGWLANSVHEDIPYLALGAHHHHQAWISRGHSRGDEVSEARAQGFRKHQDKAYDYLMEVSDTFPKIQAETYVRLLAVYRGDGKFEEAKAYFEMAQELVPDHLMLFVEHAETLQPKWGGSITQTAALMHGLPERKLIQQLVEAKLLVEGEPWKVNYFGGTMQDLKIKAQDSFLRIHHELEREPPTSIHRYMLFGYMMFLAEQTGNRTLARTYKNKLDRNLPVYPFGLPGAH